MPAPPRTGSDAPLLGAAAIRRTRRSLLALIVAIVAIATAAHHLAPMHAGGAIAGGGTDLPMAPGPHHGGAMHGAPHGTAEGEAPAPPQSDHAMPAMAMCLGTVLGGFVLAYVGAVIRAPRARRRRARRPQVPRAGAPRTGRAACRDGPPVFLRLQVLRT